LLLLLHGFTGSPRSWDPISTAFPAEQILCPALLGHDGTIGDASIRCFADEIDRIADIVRCHSAEGTHVAGYSLGGRLALGLLIQHPKLFSAGTLLGAHPGLATTSARTERLASDDAWCARLEASGLEGFVDAWQAQSLFASQSRLSRAQLEAQRRLRLRHDPAGLARSLRVLGLGAMPAYHSDLARVERPVRLLVGEFDTRFRALADEMASALPHGRVILAPNAGHNLLLECPAFVVEVLQGGMQA
jgi:2-succinyl-6-hydroxy-2,4-cyclohexadiene-1-carboxylate synthase